MTINKSFFLLSLVTLQGLILLGEGEVSRRDLSKGKSNFEVKEIINLTSYEKRYSLSSDEEDYCSQDDASQFKVNPRWYSDFNRKKNIKNRPCFYITSHNPLDLSFHWGNTVVIGHGEDARSLLTKNSDYNSFVLDSTEDDENSVVIYEDSNYLQSNYYQADFGQGLASLDKVIDIALYSKEKNIVFMRSLQSSDEIKLIAEEYREAFGQNEELLRHIDNVVFSLVLPDGTDLEEPDANVSNFINAFLVENDDSWYICPLPVSQNESLSDKDSYIAQDESSSKWSSWFSYFKRPKVVFSFVTTAGVCLGTYWLVKKGWFSENN